MPAVTPIITNVLSEGPYYKTAFVSCRSVTLGNGVTMVVNGIVAAVAQGITGYATSSSTKGLYQQV
ncbi:hypothetical protein [Chryseobacterium sp. H1D6B]|uniref:hypothetical protein n=1 Tax=Chryseobacterium sp. H1D6B TaxID=2940588 RepID=UPI0015CE7F65|nr:hypothetical protein [Chryseobacterium sp. H1D6B]